MELFIQLPDLSQYLMDHVFKDLAHLIFKVSLFPTAEVLECTGRFLELHLLICLRVVKRGYSNFLRIPEHILAFGRRQYYTTNNSKCDPTYFPFGDKLGDDKAYLQWVSTLKVGQEVDAVKFCKKDTIAIWSRAVLMGLPSHQKVVVRFEGEDNKIYLERSLNLTPFRVQPANSRGVDFLWRNSIHEGEDVDVYIEKRGWLLLRVIGITKIAVENTEEQVTTVHFRYEAETKDDEESSEGDWIGSNF